MSMPVSLYNLSPAAALLAFASAIACLPAAWVWMRHRAEGAQKRRMALAVLVLFLTFDLILVGAFTRLTDSGLGCPDWPGCYGQSNPVAAHGDISAAQAAMPSGPVTHQKAWIEMVHRYLASSVGALIVLMTVLAWRDARSVRQTSPQSAPGSTRISPWWATATLVWVCVQGAFGALTVTMKLFPAIVSLHLLGAYALLALLVVQAVQGGAFREAQPSKVTRGMRWAIGGALALLLLQATSGAWVSTNYAVLVCGDFPTCQGRWWPEMNFGAALEVWRPLGEHNDGSIVTFQTLTAIHMAHRMLALVTAAALTLLVVRLWQRAVLLQPTRILAGLLALQVATGLSNVVLDWPIAAAMLHSGGCGALVAVLVWMLVLSHPKGRAA